MHGIHGWTAASAGVLENPPRLVKAAHEFEAQMMKELLKPMTDSGLSTGEGEEDASGGALREFASEAFGKALSEQGGFGIATEILRSLGRRAPSVGQLRAVGANSRNPTSASLND